MPRPFVLTPAGLSTAVHGRLEVKTKRQRCRGCGKPLAPFNKTSICLTPCREGRETNCPVAIAVPVVVPDIVPPVYLLLTKPLPGMTPEDILQATAKILHVPMEVFFYSKGGGGELTTARYIAVVLVRTDLGYSVHKTTEFFGRKSHSLVISATVWIYERLPSDKELRRKIHAIRAQYPEKARAVLRAEDKGG